MMAKIGNIPWNKGLTKKIDARVKKNSEARKGQKRSEETKRKMRGKRISISGENNPNYGKPLSEETRRKLSIAMKGRKLSEETKERMSESRRGGNNGFYGKQHTDENKRKRSIAMSGTKHPFYGKSRSEETKEKMREANRGQIRSEETKKRISKAMKFCWQDPEFQKIMQKAFQLKPNKPEQLLMKMLDEFYPSDWKYVGDFQFWLGGKNPDFMNINGQKKLIELYGDYWHSQKVIGIPEEQHKQERIDHFKQYGFDTLVIWEKELKDLLQVEFKIHRFMRR